MYLSDNFQKPNPFQPDVVLDIDDVIERKLDILHCHTSQMYEWLPFNGGVLDEVPEDEGERRKWMAERRLRAFSETADRFRDKLIELYGEDRGGRVRYAEAFEVCEYGTSLTAERMELLFPFIKAV